MVNKIEQNIVPEKQDGSDKESAIMKIKTGTKAALLALGLSISQIGQAEVVEEPELGENEMEVIINGDTFIFDLKSDDIIEACDIYLDNEKKYNNCLVASEVVYEVAGDLAEQELAQSEQELAQSEQELAEARERRIQSEQELAQARERRIQSKQELAEARERRIQSEQELAQARERRIQSEKDLYVIQDKANQLYQEERKKVLSN